MATAAPRDLKETQAAIIENLRERMKNDQEQQPSEPTRSLAGRNIAERLERKFGLGTDPDRRRELYERLEREVEEFGDPVYAIISDVVQSALSARSPQRWFCKSVILRLREKNYLQNKIDNDW